MVSTSPSGVSTVGMLIPTKCSVVGRKTIIILTPFPDRSETEM